MGNAQKTSDLFSEKFDPTQTLDESIPNYGRSSLADLPVAPNIDISGPETLMKGSLGTELDTEAKDQNTSVLPQQEERRDMGAMRDLFVPRIHHEKMGFAGKYKLVQAWEGWVTEITTDTFKAEFNDSSGGTDRRLAVEFDKADVPESDAELLNVGAVLYWHVGYSVDSAGTLNRGSSLRFRRLPMWRAADIEKVKANAKELKAAIFPR